MERIPPLVVGRARLLHEAEVPPQLIVKFHEHTALSEADSLDFVATQTEQAFQRIAGNQTLPPPTRAIVSVPVGQVAELTALARARAAEDGRVLPDLLKFYARQLPNLSRLTFADAITATEQLLALVEAIRRNELVEEAYIESPATPPPGTVDFALEPLVADQVYLEAAPDGVGSIPLWRIDPDGCDGSGVMFVDVESGWYTNHNDLAIAQPTPVFGFNKNYMEHGTRVLGIVNAVENGSGIVGIAPGAAGYLASTWYRTHIGYERYSVSNAICSAVAFLHRPFENGHVIVVEAQVGIVGSDGVIAYLPVEAEYLAWGAITNAYYLGVVVVESAANGDRTIHQGGISSLPPGTFDFLDPGMDSGAIIVGAGKKVRSLIPTLSTSRVLPPILERFIVINRAPYVRHDYSNHGSRVNCFARGDGSYTCDLPPNGYADLFETSAATAIVAGVAIVTQALALRYGRMLSPRDLRETICRYGTPARAGSGLRLMPDLVQINEDLRNRLLPYWGLPPWPF